MRVDLRKSLFILPNLFTLSSVFCGSYAVMVCSESRGDEESFLKASLLILYAMFFDTVDGRVARLTRTQSAFGVQLDSLSDVVSFGIAPAVLVYRWSLSSLGLMGVATAFAFVACGAVRLARFNVLMMDDDGAPKKPGKYIMGLPIPAAAGTLISIVVASHTVQGPFPGSPVVIVGIMLALSAFMVSRVRFRSFKDMKISWRTFTLIGLTLGVGTTLAIRFHLSFALSWLLSSYVAIGVLEALLHSSRKRIGRRPKQIETLPTPPPQ